MIHAQTSIYCPTKTTDNQDNTLFPQLYMPFNKRSAKYKEPLASAIHGLLVFLVSDSLLNVASERNPK